MDTLIRSMMSLVVSLGLLFAGVAVADSPVKIDSPDGHSVEVKGKVSLYRVQVEGMNFGKGKNKAHAEVFVSLDSKPGMIYTLALHNSNKGASVVNEEMARTLRTAYVNKSPVTLYHQISMKQDNNFKILMVQSARMGMTLSKNNQLAGEMKMLRRLAEEGVLSTSVYKKAKAGLLDKH